MDYTNLYNFVSGTGVVVPSTDDVKSGIEDKFKEIFGADLDVTPETPVGRLIEAVTVLTKSAIGVTAQSANQFNIYQSAGQYLDSLGNIYGLTRSMGVKTKVPITVKLATELIVVPSGALIMSQKGGLFKVEDDIKATTAGDDGFWYGYGYAVANDEGDIDGEEGIVDIVQTAILGWIGVTNSKAIVIGKAVESDAEFRERILMAQNYGRGFIQALMTDLKEIDGVNGAYVIENNNTPTKITQGVILPGHSIFISVSVAASSSEPSVLQDLYKSIGNAIVESKPVGVGFAESADIPAEKISLDIYPTIGGTPATNVVFYLAKDLVLSMKIVVNSHYYVGTDIIGEVRTILIEKISEYEVGDTIYVSEVVNSIFQSNSSIKVNSLDMTYTDDSGTVIEIEDVLQLRGFEKAITSSSVIDVQLSN